MEFASNPALKVFIGSPTNCMISSTWDQIKDFVRTFGPEAAENLAKQLGSSGAAAVRHAISTFESSGPSPWTMKAAENVRLTPREFQTLISAVSQNLRAAAGNPPVRATAVGTGAAMTLGTILSASPTTLVSTYGLMAGGGILAGAILLAAGVGAAVGIGIDHGIGALIKDPKIDTFSEWAATKQAEFWSEPVPFKVPNQNGQFTAGWRWIPPDNK